MISKKQKEVSLIIGLQAKKEQKKLLVKAITELKNLFSVEQVSPITSSNKQLFASIHIRTQLSLKYCFNQISKPKKVFNKKVCMEIVYYGQKVLNTFFAQNIFFIKTLSKILPDFKEPLTNKRIKQIVRKTRKTVG